MAWMKSYKTTICGALIFVVGSLQMAGVNLGHVGNMDALQFAMLILVGLSQILGADASELERLKGILGK